jgi:cob(I)alamin adenosyltransferase
MVRRDGAETKKERLEKIARSIQAALFKEKELSFSKTLAIYEYETGLTEEKLRSYLRLLEKLGHFVIDENNDKIRKA